MGVMLPCALISSMGPWRVLPHEFRLMRGLFCFSSGSGTIGELSPNLLNVIFPLFIFLPTLLSPLTLAVVSWRRKLFDFGISRIACVSNSNDLHAQAAHRSRVQQARMIKRYFASIFVYICSCGGIRHFPCP
jgi:hypothetical protein